MVKVTFHCDEPGEWHFAVMPEGQACRPDLEPYTGIVTDYKEIAPGWLHGMRITVDVGELRGDWAEHVRGREGIVEIPIDAEFSAIGIDFYLLGRSPAGVQIDRARLIADIERIDGGSVAVVARPMNLDAPVGEIFGPAIAEVRTEMAKCGWDGATACRAVIFGVGEEGYLRQVEFAVEPG